MRPIIFAFQLIRQWIFVFSIKLRNIFFAVKVLFEVKNWKEYFKDIYFEPKEKFIIYQTKDKLQYITRPKTKDRDIFVEITLGNEYFIDEIKLAENSVVLDIGAQIGVFSVFISKKVGKIFSFEPVLGNFELLKKNIELNKLENKIKAFNFAVSAKNGKQKVFLSENNSGGHSIYGKGKFVEAETKNLEQIFNENKIQKCDLIKMDVEGAEYDVLYSSTEETFNKIERIVFECHEIDKKKKNPKKMIIFLESKGFKVKSKSQSNNFPVLFAERIRV